MRGIDVEAAARGAKIESSRPRRGVSSCWASARGSERREPDRPEPDRAFRFVTPEALQACWTFPTLALHGAENGLADVATLYRLQAVMKAAGRDIRIARLEGQGHQDSLIGVRAAETFAHIRDFLDETGPAATAPVAAWCHAQAPALGPILGVDAQGVLHAGLGAHPRLGQS